MRWKFQPSYPKSVHVSHAIYIQDFNIHPKNLVKIRCYVKWSHCNKIDLSEQFSGT